jgi:hypothetical protein
MTQNKVFWISWSVKKRKRNNGLGTDTKGVCPPHGVMAFEVRRESDAATKYLQRV